MACSHALTFFFDKVKKDDGSIRTPDCDIVTDKNHETDFERQR